MFPDSSSVQEEEQMDMVTAQYFTESAGSERGWSRK